MRVAFVLTCHNRKEKTLACLKSIFSILLDANVYLTDDGCTDGTPNEVIQEFPSVVIISGNGNLFWSRGMYYAWKEALKSDFDFYVWINDDVILLPFFWEELLYCNNIGHNKCIIVGLIKDIKTDSIIYGGTDHYGKLIQESTVPQTITNMNGNVVLVPRSVINIIGIIDPVYWHDIGDVDYGLVAAKNGIPVLSTRRAIALGYSNGKFCRVRKWGVTISQRFSRLYSPLGAPPSILFYFYKKHRGIFYASLFYAYLHLINILPDSIVKLFWGDKYVEQSHPY